MLIDQDLYRKAFQAYLRNGRPIAWSFKQARPSTYYVWRTREDDKVRSSHAANDGKIFAWDNAPPTGNPGDEFGCRCTAEPFFPEAAEYLTITLDDISDREPAWDWRDFVRHYFNGQGREVTVRETGNLKNVIARYLDLPEDRLKNQVANKARENPEGIFVDNFNNTYNLTGVVFSIGDTTIGGSFSGRASTVAGAIALAGEFEFYLHDKFADPADIGETERRIGIVDADDVEIIDIPETIYENVLRPLDDHGRYQLGLPATGPRRFGIETGEPFLITDRWSGRFLGKINSDTRQSIYR